MRLFSTEQVTKYHPDKYADQISDAVLDACLNEDQNSHVACECMVKGETVVLAGEIRQPHNGNHRKSRRSVDDRRTRSRLRTDRTQDCLRPIRRIHTGRRRSVQR